MKAIQQIWAATILMFWWSLSVYFYFDPELSSIDPAKSGILVAKLNDASIENIQIHAYQPNAEELAKAVSK